MGLLLVDSLTCIGIEQEGSGEAWTPKQLEASARLVAWLSGYAKWFAQGPFPNTGPGQDAVT
jgi:hypothetical protein